MLGGKDFGLVKTSGQMMKFALNELLKRKNGNSLLSSGPGSDVMDKLRHQDCFTNAGAADKTNPAAF